MKKLLISLVLTCISMASSATSHQLEDTSTVNLERASAFAHTVKQNEMFSQPSLTLVRSSAASRACNSICRSLNFACLKSGKKTCAIELSSCKARCF
ncbi:hypothetical protein HC752_01270 [Vibrio sp. S9_S30]|uniref:hypothetical protein n=1 Tax=Vibrio sp. S9_S30 TaxID=2720226 RepID=UPI001680C0FF|nr:hypothetical protein [Vibrio sp. S9_S30]MBD1555564.1 hypothetical protein [Vibrio sp. S9_S30]